jgi:hypothetical protein
MGEKKTSVKKCHREYMRQLVRLRKSSANIQVKFHPWVLHFPTRPRWLMENLMTARKKRNNRNELAKIHAFKSVPDDDGKLITARRINMRTRKNEKPTNSRLGLFFSDDDIDRFIEASLNWPSPIADNRWFDYIISVLPHSESTPHPDGHCVTHTHTHHTAMK